MKILVTGFETFGGLRVNPSEKIVRGLDARRDPGLVTDVLPTEFGSAERRIRNLLQIHRPEAVICLGVARSRTVVSLERFAMNLDDTPEADNSGRIRIGRTIVKGGPLAYRTTLPLSRILNAIEAAGIPVAISNHAGTYVCNHVFYVARHILESAPRKIPCGFIHLPPVRAGRSPGMKLSDMMAAVDCCLAVLQRRHR